MLINSIRLLNVLIAISSIYPSVKLIRILIEERGELARRQKPLNSILTILFAVIPSAGIVSGFLSLALFIQFDFESVIGGHGAQLLFNGRNLIVNISIALTAWGLYIVAKHKR